MCTTARNALLGAVLACALLCGALAPAHAQEIIRPQDFGARADGSADPARIRQETAAVRDAMLAAIATGKTLHLGGPDCAYAINTVAIDTPITQLTIDGAGATVVAHAPFAFQFGPNARYIDELTLPPMDNITITGIRFTQEQPRRHGVYLFLAGVSNTTIAGNRFEHVGNGGVLVANQSRDVVIADNVFQGVADQGPNRGIWITGTRTRQYHPPIIDLGALTADASPLPDEASAPPTRITARHNVLREQSYGIYVQNARRVSLVENDIEIRDGARCIAINYYSPHTTVQGGRCAARQDATGILVTRASHDVLIDGVRFEGSFGRARIIQIAFLAEAEIRRCVFAASATMDVQVNTGARARILRNDFRRPAWTRGWHIYYSTLDPFLAGRCIGQRCFMDMGARAIAVPGVEIIGNQFGNKRVPIQLEQQAAPSNGRVARMEESRIEANTFYGRDHWALRDTDHLVHVVNALDRGRLVKPIRYTFMDNAVLGGGADRPAIHDPFRALNDSRATPVLTEWREDIDEPASLVAMAPGDAATAFAPDDPVIPTPAAEAPPPLPPQADNETRAVVPSPARALRRGPVTAEPSVVAQRAAARPLAAGVVLVGGAMRGTDAAALRPLSLPAAPARGQLAARASAPAHPPRIVAPTATCVADGTRIEWRARLDTATTGFGIERAGNATGPFATRAFVSAHVDEPNYSWFDGAAQPHEVYWYRLEAYTVHGPQRLAEPFTCSQRGESARPAAWQPLVPSDVAKSADRAIDTPPIPVLE